MGNLRFSVHWILTNVFATYADILTSASSISPFDLTSSYNRTLPYPYSILYDAVSVICLSPGVFSARRRLTSELLRTLSRVAASKPTSWLSLHLYLLNHLAYIWDLNWRSGLFPSWPRILSLVASLLDITLPAFGV